MPLLVSNINNVATSQTVLTTLVKVASIDPSPFTQCLPQLQAAIRRQPGLLSMAGKIFGALGRLSPVSVSERISQTLVITNSDLVKP